MEQLLEAVETLLGNLRRDEQDGWWASDADVSELEKQVQLFDTSRHPPGD